MAMPVAGLAVGVAAVLVEPASMSEGGGGEKRRKKSGEKSFHEAPRDRFDALVASPYHLATSDSDSQNNIY
jgi:hypothetical protein